MTGTSSSGSPRPVPSPRSRRSPISPPTLAEGDDLVAIALAGLAPFPVAAIVSALPASPVGTAVSLLSMVAVVVLAAWLGGRRAGLAAAVVAGLSFDFFHTVPVHALRLDADDLAAVALLVVLGLLVGGRATTPVDGRS